MQASSIVASVAISCFLSTVVDFFKDNSNNVQIMSETNRSELHDIASRVLSHERWIHEILQGNITSLETELTKTKDAAMGECQKVTEYLQTNKTEVLALQERQGEHHQLIVDQKIRLNGKDKALADLEKKVDDMQSELLQYREAGSGRIDTAETSTSLEQLIQQSQGYPPIRWGNVVLKCKSRGVSRGCDISNNISKPWKLSCNTHKTYLPISVILLAVGEVVLFLILIVSRRVAETVPSESSVKPDTQKNSRGKRPRKKH